jgi:hypothetical protein
MSIPLEKLKIKHISRSANLHITKTVNVNKYLETVPNYKKDIWTVLNTDKKTPLTYMYYVSLEDSIHYNALKTNNYNIYNELIEKNKQTEHSVENFKNLLINWDENKIEKITLEYDGKMFILQDGIHRLSIMKYKGLIEHSVPFRYLDIKYNVKIINKIEKLLQNTTNLVHKNGWNNRTKYGYHSFDIFNIKFIGQRNPTTRLEIMRKYYNFTDKKVIDIGCNSGGMLLHLFEIKIGRGYDFDSNCVKAGNEIVNLLGVYKDIQFEVVDLETTNMAFQFENIKPDCIFLLSLGSWIKNWEEIYKSAINSNATIFLETNNNDEGVPQLKLFNDMGYNILKISEYSYDDTTNNISRTTYMITKN